MSQYRHLTMNEREKILVLHLKKQSLEAIAKEIGRCKSSISRELNRNSIEGQGYSAVEAEKKYRERRKKCRRTKLLEQKDLKSVVTRLFLEKQWSPEQIANRLIHENSAFQVSYATIYRGIYAGMFDTPEQKRSRGNRGAIRKLRHRGKKRRRKESVETRGKIFISNRIQDRPEEADNRQAIGHWEADTVAGKAGSACLVTIADRCSRYLLARKVAKKRSSLVADEMISLLSPLPENKRRSMTPDRGKEFSMHDLVTNALNGLQFYFPNPHSPWQRGTNENTNGLLREYLPKSVDISRFSDEQIAGFIEKLNLRPRKCLGWKAPFEVFFLESLHLT